MCESCTVLEILTLICQKLRCHVTLITPTWGTVCHHHKTNTSRVNPCTNFDDSIFSHSREIYAGYVLFLSVLIVKTQCKCCYLPQHECTHDKRTKDSDEAENGRRIKAVDTCYVTGAKERRQQKQNLSSLLN